MQHNEEQGVAHLKKALEAAPNGEFAPAIKMMIRQFDHAKKPAAKKPAPQEPADE